MRFSLRLQAENQHLDAVVRHILRGLAGKDT